MRWLTSPVQALCWMHMCSQSVIWTSLQSTHAINGHADQPRDLIQTFPMHAGGPGTISPRYQSLILYILFTAEVHQHVTCPDSWFSLTSCFVGKWTDNQNCDSWHACTYLKVILMISTGGVACKWVCMGFHGRFSPSFHDLSHPLSSARCSIEFVYMLLKLLPNPSTFWRKGGICCSIPLWWKERAGIDWGEKRKSPIRKAMGYLCRAACFLRSRLILK